MQTTFDAQTVLETVKSLFEKHYGIIRLEFKWTKSRGRETYGYNICSLWIDRKKVYSCMGGNYDMEATCLAGWLNETFETGKALNLMFFDEINAALSNEANKGKSHAVSESTYGVVLDLHLKHARINGSSGFSSVELIANKLGIALEKSRNNCNANLTTYYASLTEEAVEVVEQ